MAELEQMQIGGVIPATVWNMKTASVSQIDSVCGFGKGKNLLDNWYWVGGGQFPVNQRGQVKYTTAGYTIDRWAINRLTLEPIQDGLSLTWNGESPDIGGLLYTTLENGYLPKGLMTFSAIIDSSLYSISFEFKGSNIPRTVLTGPSTYFMFEVSVNNAYTQVCLRIFTKEKVVIQAVKLELGDTQTLATQDENGNWVLSDPSPDYTLELLKCRRYYKQMGIGLVAFGQNGTPLFVTPFDTPMRANPTVKILTNSFNLFDASIITNVTVTGASLSTGVIKKDGISYLMVAATYNPAIVNGRIYRYNSDFPLLEFIADL